MEIDTKIEALVRETLQAAANQDIDGFDTALKAFPDDDARRKGLHVAVAVSSAALYDMHGGRPSGDQVRETAQALAQAGAWAAVTGEEAMAYLVALVNGSPLEEALDPQLAVLLIFVMTSALLNSPRARQRAEGGSWSGYFEQLQGRLRATRSGSMRNPA
ncbi:MAG: hypothetical protein ACRDT8_00685 [Micromonosporaceae bacterium]